MKHDVNYLGVTLIGLCVRLGGFGRFQWEGHFSIHRFRTPGRGVNTP